jgi:hypothetical protein
MHILLYIVCLLLLLDAASLTTCVSEKRATPKLERRSLRIYQHEYG